MTPIPLSFFPLFPEALFLSFPDFVLFPVGRLSPSFGEKKPGPDLGVFCFFVQGPSFDQRPRDVPTPINCQREPFP